VRICLASRDIFIFLFSSTFGIGTNSIEIRLN
jgi:hypothetical protein